MLFRSLGMAKQSGLFAIQRFFLPDSRSFDTAMKIMESSKIDAVELLPALIAINLADQLKEFAKLPLLAGGFVRDREMVKTIKDIGFMGLTVSDKSLW